MHIVQWNLQECDEKQAEKSMMDHVQYEILDEKNYEWTEFVGLKITYKVEEQQHTHPAHTHTNPAELTENCLVAKSGPPLLRPHGL